MRNAQSKTICNSHKFVPAEKFQRGSICITPNYSTAKIHKTLLPAPRINLTDKTVSKINQTECTYLKSNYIMNKTKQNKPIFVKLKQRLPLGKRGRCQAEGTWPRRALGSGSCQFQVVIFTGE